MPIHSYTNKMAGSGGAGNSVFLIRALEKIVGDKETKRAQHQQLKKACEEALSKCHPSHFEIFN